LPAVPFVGTRAERSSSTKGKGKAASGPAEVKPIKAKLNGARRLQSPQRRSVGLSGRMRDNWETGQHLKRLHATLGREFASEGTLGPDSDDDGTEDLAHVNQADYSLRPIPRSILDSPHAHDVNRDCMEAVSHRVLGHAGFDGASAMAIGILAHVATEYVANLGRTLRLYSDRFGARLGPEEMLLHALAENGVARPGELTEFVEDEVIGRGNRLKKQVGRLDRLREAHLAKAVDEAGKAAEVDGEDWALGNDAEAIAR